MMEKPIYRLVKGVWWVRSDKIMGTFEPYATMYSWLFSMGFKTYKFKYGALPRPYVKVLDSQPHQKYLIVK